MITHSKKFGVYHWDTFDNETIQINEGDDFDELVEWTEDHYGDRIKHTGADRAEIVNDKGDIVKTWRVG